MPTHTNLIRKASVAQIAREIRAMYEERKSRDQKARPRPVTFLLGAGISRSVGIKLASEIVTEIKARPDIEETLKEQPLPPNTSDYAHLMSLLTPAQRVDLFRKLIDAAYEGSPKRAKINWCHLLLATLAYHGYVNQFLTVNFDPLLVEAMALTGQRILSFDLLASSNFTAGKLEPGAIIYLHGQASGLFLANTASETTALAERLPPVLQDAMSDSIVIALGYGGECDPVLEAISSQFRQFSHRLYWVPYKSESNLAKEAREFLEKSTREAFLVEGYDADQFMRDLVIEHLKLDLPGVVLDPLADAKRQLERIQPYPALEQVASAASSSSVTPSPPEDILTTSKKLVERAIDAVTQPKPTRATATAPLVTTYTPPPKEPFGLQISMARLSKDFDRLEALRQDPRSQQAEFKTVLGDAYIVISWSQNKLERRQTAIDRARELGTTEPAWLELAAGDLELTRAQQSQGEMKDAHFAAACNYFAEAVRIQPKMHEAYNNWGYALLDKARTKTGPEADQLFAESFAKFAEAIRIQPKMHEAFNNWGNALFEKAKTKTGPEADRLFTESFAKYAAAIRIKPDKHETYCNWGNTLAHQAKSKTEPEADRLFTESYTKYAEAIRFKPDDHNTYYNWGAALATQAMMKTGPEVDRLTNESIVKFIEAIRIKPDSHEAYNNWGAALITQAKSGPDADRLFDDATYKLREALRIAPEHSSAYFNLACIAGLRDDAEMAVKHLENWLRYSKNPRRTNLDSETDFDRIRQVVAFVAFRERVPE